MRENVQERQGNVIRSEDVIFLISPSVTGEDALAVLGQIGQQMNAYLSREQLQQCMQIETRMVCSPKDGVKTEELLNKIGVI